MFRVATCVLMIGLLLLRSESLHAQLSSIDTKFYKFDIDLSVDSSTPAPVSPLKKANRQSLYSIKLGTTQPGEKPETVLVISPSATINYTSNALETRTDKTGGTYLDGSLDVALKTSIGSDIKLAIGATAEVLRFIKKDLREAGITPIQGIVKIGRNFGMWEGSLSYVPNALYDYKIKDRLFFAHDFNAQLVRKFDISSAFNQVGETASLTTLFVLSRSIANPNDFTSTAAAIDVDFSYGIAKSLTFSLTFTGVATLFDNYFGKNRKDIAVKLSPSISWAITDQVSFGAVTSFAKRWSNIKEQSVSVSEIGAGPGAEFILKIRF